MEIPRGYVYKSSFIQKDEHLTGTRSHKIASQQGFRNYEWMQNRTIQLWVDN